MSASSIEIVFVTDRTPAEAYAMIVDPRRWWDGEFDGPTDVLGGEFSYVVPDLHRSVQRVTELVPGERVVWRVVDAHLTFLADPAEWTGTDIVFDLVPTSAGTEVRFVHRGITPEVECYDRCAPAWRHFVGARLRGVLEEDAVRRSA
jgi:Activator of Hsp90 ATPase homolog 1-like protein